MSDLVNLAFVGTGAWAQQHHFPTLKHLREEGVPLRLRGVTSLELEEAECVAAYDVIMQLTPLTVPIFSEKPPGISLDQAQSLSERVTVPNVVAFNRRYEPLNNLYKTTVDAMSDLSFVEGHFMRHRRFDEAFMIGTGIHWINFMSYLFGEIRHVRTTRLRDPATETWIWLADLIFEGGLRGMLKVIPCSGSQYERLAVHSHVQSAYLQGALASEPGRIIVERGHERRVIAPEDDAVQPDFIRLGIAGEYREFVNAVLRGKPTRSNFQNAVNTMRIAEAMEYGFDV